MRLFPRPMLTLTPADIARGAPDGPVMEVVTFRLTTATDPDAFLAAARASAAPLRGQPGYVSRRLLSDGAGTWTDLVEWRSLAEAQDAAKVVMADPAFGAFVAMIDMATVTMRHQPILWSMSD